MSSYLAEGVALAAVVDAVQIGGSDVFRATYDYDEPNLPSLGLPAAVVQPAPTGSGEDMYGNVNSQTFHTWVVRMHFPWEGTSASEALARAGVDATLTALRKTNTVVLGGEVDYAVVGEHEWGFLSTSENTPPTRVCSVRVRARSLIQRT